MSGVLSQGCFKDSGMNAKTRFNTCEIVFVTLHLKKKWSSEPDMSLVMRRLIRTQHTQRQRELPRFTSRLLDSRPHLTGGTGATVGSRSVWPPPPWPHNFGQSFQPSGATCPTSATQRKNWQSARPSIVFSGVMLVACTDHSRTDGTGFCLRPAAQSKNIPINGKFCSQHISTMIFLQGCMWSSSGKWEKEQFFFFLWFYISSNNSFLAFCAGR